MKRYKDMVKIGNEIEKIVDRQKKPLATIRELIDCYKTLKNKSVYKTINSDVATFFEQYNCTVKQFGIGFEIQAQ